MVGTRVLAVDMGATSVRVASVDLTADLIEPEIVQRFHHGPDASTAGEGLRWDWENIVSEVRRGIDLALELGPVASIGVCGWAVDYGLLDDRGELLSAPWSHRDDRTHRWRDVADRIGPERIFTSTGIQLLPINTLFQLAFHDRRELARAERLLLLPDLMVHELTGHVVAERSNASSTSLLDPRTLCWDEDLLAEIDVSPALFPDVSLATTPVGTHRGVPVHLVGSHDTASAFVAAPGVPGPDTAFVSMGTWVLVGSERDVVDTSPAARERNFSNELGALGGVRFLKNVMGFWLLERCREQWGATALDELIGAAAAEPAGGPTFDATGDHFLNPPDMESEIRRAAGLSPSATPAAVTRCILDSIVEAVSEVIGELSRLVGTPMRRIAVVGGGTRHPLVTELLERRSGLPVDVGSAEATALGNALVQGIALGCFEDLHDARRSLSGFAI